MTTEHSILLSAAMLTSILTINSLQAQDTAKVKRFKVDAIQFSASALSGTERLTADELRNIAPDIPDLAAHQGDYMSDLIYSKTSSTFGVELAGNLSNKDGEQYRLHPRLRLGVAYTDAFNASALFEQVSISTTDTIINNGIIGYRDIRRSEEDSYQLVSDDLSLNGAFTLGTDHRRRFMVRAGVGAGISRALDSRLVVSDINSERTVEREAGEEIDETSAGLTSFSSRESSRTININNGWRGAVGLPIIGGLRLSKCDDLLSRVQVQIEIRPEWRWVQMPGIAARSTFNTQAIGRLSVDLGRRE